MAERTYWTRNGWSSEEPKSGHRSNYIPAGAIPVRLGKEDLPTIELDELAPGEEIVTIGEETLLITDEGVEGEVVYPRETTEALAAVRAEPVDHIPDPGAREWKRTTAPARNGYYAKQDPPGTVRMCKNDRCANIVTPSRNPGVLKLFCCGQCAQRYHARQYHYRYLSGSGTYVEQDARGNPARFNRVKSKNAKLAGARYQNHIQRGREAAHMCPLATKDTNWNCPAFYHMDFDSKEQRCLVYATLVDDMKEHWAIDRGEVYIRQYTTDDGRWLVGSELDPNWQEKFIRREA